MKNKRILALIAFFTGIPFAVYGMHIAEGFLPPLWTLLYYVVCIPFAFVGLKKIKEAGADKAVLTLKSFEALAKVADGKATKIIIPLHKPYKPTIETNRFIVSK